MIKKRYFVEVLHVRNERVAYRGLIRTANMPRLIEKLAHKGYMVALHYEWPEDSQPRIVHLGVEK
jgi:hypothetical protein